MARLDVWAPRGSRTRGLLLEVQSDLHAVALPTRMCAPLLPETSLQRVFPVLNPVFAIGGRRYVMATQAIAPYDRERLATWLGNLAEHQDAIIKAIDHLMLGIWSSLRPSAHIEAAIVVRPTSGAACYICAPIARATPR